MNNKYTNETKVSCDDRKCFYEDYWKLMTHIHHKMTYQAWAMSIGELRTLKDEVTVMHCRAVSLVIVSECYDDAKEENKKYFTWIQEAESNLSTLYDHIVDWMNILNKIYNNLNVFIDSNKCPLLESFTGKSPWE